MELIRGIHNIRPSHHGCVATIGNFDGVHLGHQAVLGQLSEKAAAMGVPSVVITFEPQPMEFFLADKAPPRLTRLREKYQALRRFSLDRMCCLQFCQGLSEMSADDFIQKLLIDGLGVRYLVVGDDFRFGKERKGDFALLQERGHENGFQVVNMHTFAIEQERVSSTRIRKHLTSGDLQGAEKLLGRPYRMSGRVAHGDKRGRTIGFPTANIFMHRKVAPVNGVFAVEMFGLDKEPLPGVANVGKRPTVGGERHQLEVHLFDFSGDIYGRHVHVDFLLRIRDEKKFASFMELKTQIENDAQAARRFFEQRYHSSTIA